MYKIAALPFQKPSYVLQYNQRSSSDDVVNNLYMVTFQYSKASTNNHMVSAPGHLLRYPEMFL